MPLRSSKKKAKEEKERVEDFLREERERADQLVTILTDIHKNILNEANKLQPELPEFYQKIHPILYNDTVNIRDLVGVLIEELEIHLNQKRELEKYVEQLKRESNALKSQLHEKDNEALQNHQRRIAGPREDWGKKNQEHQAKIERLVQDYSLLEDEKRHVVEGQQALKLEHENAMQRLKKDHEKRIKDIQRAQQLAEGDLEAKHNAEKISQQRIYDVEKRELQNSLQAKYDIERNNLHATHDTERSRLRRGYDADEKRLSSIIAGLQRDLSAEKSGLQARISEIQNQQQNHELRIEEMKQRHQSTIEYMEQGHESERVQWHAKNANMLQDYESEKDIMQKKHDSTIAQMTQEHESAIAQMTQEHESAIAQMTQEHESKQAQLIAQISQMEKEHSSEQERMRKDFEARKLQLECQTTQEETRLKTEYKVKKAQLEIAHAEEKERLRKDVDEYSKALLARDDFKPTPDSEIKARFLDLAQDVDALARLEWKVNQKEWTSQVLRLLSPNQRLLKKQILQDSIWIILYEYVFCSPFRIFGEEGRSLETQWNGKGLSPDTLYLPSQALTSADSQLDNRSYKWPKPEMEIERWRYVNIKECRAALTQPIPSEWDPRAKLKKGFKTSIDALRKEFISTLGEVANLDKNNVQAMEKMTIKAANMWLEFGMQRCRILVVLQGSNLKSAKERIQRAQEDTLKLVVVPELKRFGNSKGLDLHIEETVSNCDGETINVSMRQ